MALSNNGGTGEPALAGKLGVIGASLVEAVASNPRLTARAARALLVDDDAPQRPARRRRRTSTAARRRNPTRPGFRESDDLAPLPPWAALAAGVALGAAGMWLWQRHATDDGDATDAPA